MNVTVKNGSLNGSVSVPPSKSVAHRAIILSAILGTRTSIYGNLNSKDIQATLGAMETLGAGVIRNESGVTITAIKEAKGNVFNVQESGSTMRFLLPLIPVYNHEFSMEGAGRIGERTISALRKTMAENGVQVSADFLPVSVIGKYNSNEFTVSPKESSQFVTGLLFTLTALGGGRLKIDGELTSKGYVDITLEVMKKFGVDVSYSSGEYQVNVPAQPVITKDVVVNADWSSACFWVVAGVLGGEIKVKGLEYPDAQPDSIILSVLKEMGADVEFSGGTVVAKKSTLKAIEFNADSSPDIVPILSVACAFAKGVSTITGVSRLRIKESDRVKAVTDMLTACGIKVESGEDYIKIWGTNNAVGGVIDSVNDHRIAMSGIILGSIANGETTVKGVECVSKSYPDFLVDFKSLGGSYE